MEFKLPSGATLVVTPSSFEDAMTLQRAILSTVKGLPLSKNFFDMDLTVLKDAVINAATSVDVENALFKCMARASYERVKVTKELFDDIQLGQKAREDYYTICWKIVEVNCGPFVMRVFSELKATMGKQNSENPKSQS